jgi:hypothetical protein
MDVQREYQMLSEITARFSVQQVKNECEDREKNEHCVRHVACERVPEILPPVFSGHRSDSLRPTQHSFLDCICRLGARLNAGRIDRGAVRVGDPQSRLHSCLKREGQDQEVDHARSQVQPKRTNPPGSPSSQIFLRKKSGPREQRLERGRHLRFQAELLRRKIPEDCPQGDPQLAVLLTALPAEATRELRAAVEAARRSRFGAQPRFTSRGRTDRPVVREERWWVSAAPAALSTG